MEFEKSALIFQDLGIEKTHIEVSESSQPFPPSFTAAKGLISKINVIIAKTSIFLKKGNKNWG